MSVDLGPKLGLLINADIGEIVVDQLRPFLRFIDAALMGSVINSTTTIPPTTPSNGDAYLLLGTPTGVWSGSPNAIAVWSTEITLQGSNTKLPGWDFWMPKEGWAVWDPSSGGLWTFTQGAWTRSVTIGNSAQPGVGTSVCYDQFHALANTILHAGLSLGIATVTSSATLSSGTATPVIFVDATAANVAVTLPAAASNLLYFIKRQDSEANSNTATISPAAGETIDKGGTLTLPNLYSVVLFGSGSNWSIISSQASSSGTLPKMITVASTPTTSFDFSQSLTQKTVLTADTTLSFTGAQAGDRVAALLSQDEAGPHDLTWGANILGVSGGGWEAGTSGLFEFVFDGTSYFSTGSPIVGM